LVDRKEDYSRYFRPIREDEVRDWRPAPKSDTAKVFETFVNSDHQMVEVKIDELPEPKHKKGSKDRSTKHDSFASSFYSWKRKKRIQRLLEKLGIDILIIRRGERIALKKTKRKKE